ncbi:hypothetical protein [Streptomyces syringium]|uniref:hypothetical protein n=1 Tax=Streptomyces syringium TaxID=76729 RepID=UPI003AABB4B8
MATDEIMRRGQEILAAREAALKPLAEMLTARQRIRDEFAETEEPYSRLYVNAQAAGWTEDELEALGAETPARRPKGRPRRKTAAAKFNATGSGAGSKNVPASTDPAPGKTAEPAVPGAEDDHHS